ADHPARADRGDGRGRRGGQARLRGDDGDAQDRRRRHRGGPARLSALVDPDPHRRRSDAAGGGLTAHETTSAADTHASCGSAATSLRAELRAALRGTDADYTRIPLKRAVILLAVPMMLELVLESTFAVVDIFFVAKLGSSAVATAGLTETYLFLLYAIAIGLAMAVTAIVARRVGEHRGEEASLSAVQAIALAVLVSLPFAVGGI